MPLGYFWNFDATSGIKHFCHAIFSHGIKWPKVASGIYLPTVVSDVAPRVAFGDRSFELASPSFPPYMLCSQTRKILDSCHVKGSGSTIAVISNSGRDLAVARITLCCGGSVFVMFLKSSKECCEAELTGLCLRFRKAWKIYHTNVIIWQHVNNTSKTPFGR